MSQVFLHRAFTVKMAQIDQKELIDKQANAEIFEHVKCKACGGNMVFDPNTQKLKCEHCGTEEDFIKDKEVKELDILEGFKNAEKWSSGTMVYRCANCGASIVMTANEVAKNCPYCSTPQVVQTEDLAGIKPNAVYPFLLDKPNAKTTFLKWAKKRFLAPTAFKKNVDPDKINGVYQPCFTFDSNTSSVYEGRIGKTHTRTVRRNGKSYTESYTVWRNISGRYDDFFNDVTITAGNSVNQKSMNKLMPFPIESIQVYEEKYLSGFSASHYDKDITQSWEEAKSYMDSALRSRILSRYSYDQVAYLNVSTTHEGVTYKYVLVPVYIVNYTYKKKYYKVFVNGSTGRTTGKSPVSWIKATLFGLGIAAVVIGLILLFMKLL